MSDFSYINNITSTAQSTIDTSRVQNGVSGLNANSTKEELEAAAKSFEAYFVEQMLKEVKETFTSEEDSDSTVSQTKDFYMDSTIQSLAETLVDEFGGSFTDQMVEQMARNYGIDISEKAE